MSDLWDVSEPESTELGERAEMALRFSWLSNPWVEAGRHDPEECVCCLLPVFFNHVAHDVHRDAGPCECTGCREVRERWRVRRLW